MSQYTFKDTAYSSHTMLLDLMPTRGEGRRVLDLGCADGHLAGALAARGYRVTGIEHHAPAHGEFACVEADLDGGLPALEGPFDFVLCADVLEHLKHPLDLLRAARGVLAPGGTLLASLPNSGQIYFRLNVLAGRFPEQDRGLFDRTHLHFYMWRNWRALFRQAGLTIRTRRVTAVPVSLAIPALEGKFAARLLERISYDLARLWKTMFAYQFVVTADAGGETRAC